MRKLVFSPGEFYHIYNRGTDKRDIFLTQRDYNRFLLLLFHFNNVENTIIRIEDSPFDLASRGDTLVDICAYCLMPNHFHLLLREKKIGGISSFMQKLSTGYTMYFNKLLERSGSLFEGTFKATHANEDNYLKYLFSYIHLNPIKLIDPRWKENGIADPEKAKKYLSQYRFSSYLDYLGEIRPEGNIIEKTAAPEYFESDLDFKDVVDGLLKFKS